MSSCRWMLAGTLAAALVSPAWSAEGDGLTPNVDQLPWARLQGRVSVTSLATPSPLWRGSEIGRSGAGLTVQSASVFGDYYFSSSVWSALPAGGFRATSGLIVGPRSQAWPVSMAGGRGAVSFSVDRRVFGSSSTSLASDGSNDTTTPYVGIGYTGLSARGDWSFSADMGMAAYGSGGAVKLGRSFGAGQNLDDAVREMRLTPVLQLGVSYSF